jgi:hypothetical protein
VLEQAFRERFGRLAVGDRQPEIHRRLAARDPDPFPLEQVEEERTLAAVSLACLLDVLLVAPGNNGCTLNELLRRGADRRPERLQSVLKTTTFVRSST